MGDDLNNSQFDFDEDALVATSVALSESEGEDSIAEDVNEAKLKKKESKKRKFAEMKEKKKNKLKEDNEAEGSGGGGVAIQSATEAYETVLAAIRDTRHRSATVPEDMFYIPKAGKKGDVKQKCPFFLAIQTKLPDFQNMKKVPGEEVGSPLVIIVSAGAVRSVEIIKSLSRYAQCKVAKLFAKHFKLEDQVEMLREYHPVAVGTPHRLNKLVDIGALSLTNTRVVLIDMGTDEKSFTLLNSPNVKEDFFKFFVENVSPRAPDVHVALVK